MVQFSAPWSQFLKVISAIISIVLCVAFWYSSVASDEYSQGFQAFLIAFPVVLLGGSALFIIRRYEVTDEFIEVVRIIGRKKYRIDNIESVEADPTLMDLSIRTFGNGGMFSISGFFRNRRLGSYRAFVSNKSNAVVMHRKKGSPIVVSPDDPDAFVKEISSRI
ncbi:MAG: PH domain-containing protein [Chloroflexota bacterium]